MSVIRISSHQHLFSEICSRDIADTAVDQPVTTGTDRRDGDGEGAGLSLPRKRIAKEDGCASGSIATVDSLSSSSSARCWVYRLHAVGEDMLCGGDSMKM